MSALTSISTVFTQLMGAPYTDSAACVSAAARICHCPHLSHMYGTNSVPNCCRTASHIANASASVGSGLRGFRRADGRQPVLAFFGGGNSPTCPSAFLRLQLSQLRTRFAPPLPPLDRGIRWSRVAAEPFG